MAVNIARTMKMTPQKEASKLRQFNPENCDIRTQLMFEDWATVPMFRIMTLVLARKGKGVFSGRGIAEMINVPKSTVYDALKTLCDHQYLMKVGDRYNLLLSIDVRPVGQEDEKVSESPDELSGPPDKVSEPSDSSVRPTGPNNNKQIIIKNDDKENEARPSLEPVSKFEKAVEEVLVSDDNPEIQADSRFISAGRKPIKNYPLIWLSKTELIDILTLYEESEIPIDKRGIYKQAFRAVQARLLTMKAEGKSITRVSAFNWLIGWALNELLDSQKKVTDLKRSNKYLQNAGAR